MGSESITQILTICLAISIIVLFVLVVIFIALKMKRNNNEKSSNNQESKVKDVNVKENTALQSNIAKTKSYTTENIKNFMDFTEIKDNMILQKDGKRFVMVIRCQGVNYDLMSSVEKTGVEQGFSQFLNTLTKPIQLYIQSRKVNLEERIESYKKRLEIIEENFEKIKLKYEQAQKNPNITDKKFKDIKLEYVRQKNLYEYTKDLIVNTEKMSLNQNILTKNYYIVISHYPEATEELFQKEEIMEMAFSELYTNSQAILRALAVCGVTGKVLNSVELADLLYVAYNRDTSEIYGADKAISSGYDALYTTAPNVINKRMEQLDKLIDQRAFDLASRTIENTMLKSRKEKELEQKEKNMEELIKELAKSMIKEEEQYIPKEIVQKSLEEIDNIGKKEQTKTKKVKKGA